jgi:hypothetical protein
MSPPYKASPILGGLVTKSVLPDHYEGNTRVAHVIQPGIAGDLLSSDTALLLLGLVPRCCKNRRPEVRFVALPDALLNPSWGWFAKRRKNRDSLFSFRGKATVGIHERERSILLSGPRVTGGPPGSRSSHLGIKRGMHMVGLVRWGRNYPRIKEFPSGGVGMVCGMKCGISERAAQLGKALTHQ